MEKLNFYIDGPNLLGAVGDLLKERRWIDPVKLSRHLIDPKTQEIKKIYYLETPYRENVHTREVFKKQQSFFGHLHQYIKSSQIKKIEGNYKLSYERVPAYLVNQLNSNVQKIVQLLKWQSPVEKGGDIGLAVRMVRDAFKDEFDRAVLITADLDFVPAIRIVISDAHKKVSVSYVHNMSRDALGLTNACPEASFIQITKKMILDCLVADGGA